MNVTHAALAATLTGVSILGLSACSSSSTPADFTAVSAKPTVTQVDTGATGSTVGDYTVFNAAVTKDGQPFGVLYGQKLLVAEPGQDGAPQGLGRYENHLEFDLPDGTISVEGLQFYTTDGSVPDVALTKGEDRAIVGGTGAYAGAHGVLHSTTNADGTRTQSFDFS
jgi:hypothetical protein